MSEYMTEVGPGQRGSLSSFSMMAGQGEGIYASPTSVDVGLQQRDVEGLTHFTKTQPKCKQPLDACKITDQDLQDALQQYAPLLAEREQRQPSSHTDSIYSTHRRYVTASNKRRRLSKDVYKPLPLKPPSAPAIWPESVSLPARKEYEPTKRFLQPFTGPGPSEPVMFHHETQSHDGGGLSRKTSELCFPAAVGSTNGTQEIRRKVESASVTTHEKIDPVEAINARSEAFEISHKMPVDCRRIINLASDSADLNENLKDVDRLFHHGSHSKICEDGFESVKSAGDTDVYRYKELWDPDLPLNSVEEEIEDPSVGCHIGNHKSKSLGIAERAVHVVPNGLLWSPYQTMAGADIGHAQKEANKTVGKLALSQNSLGLSRKSSQTSTLVPIAKALLQNSLKALSERYSEALSSHKIPAELRQYFQALLRKFQTDEQFQRAVITYAMEKTGAMPPEKGSTGPMPLKLRQGFDTVWNKYHTDEQFKISVEKFATEYLGDVKDDGDLNILDCDLDELPEKIKPHPNLDELSREDLTNYCRKLEKRWAAWARKARSERDLSRVGRPKDPNPQPGSWTCYHPQTTRTADKATDDCGCKTPFYSKDHVWVKNTHCRRCKAPHDETLVSHNAKRGSRTQTNRLPSAGQTIPATPRSIIAAQPNAQVNAQAYAQDYYAASSPPDHSSVAQLNDLGASPTVREAFSRDASTPQMYGSLSENGHPDLRFRSPGWHIDNDSISQTPTSDQFHPTSVSGSPWNIHGGTTDYFPRQMSSSQTPSISHMDALQIDMNLTGQDGEFDEFALQMDSDMNMGIDSLFEEVEWDMDAQEARFPGQSNLPQTGAQQSLPNSPQRSTYYPTQVNSLAPHTNLNLQNQVQRTSRISSTADRTLIAEPGYASASTSEQYHRNDGNLAPPRLEQMGDHFQSYPSRQFPHSGIIGSSHMRPRGARAPKVKNPGPGRGAKTTSEDDSSSKMKRASPMKARAPQPRKIPSRPNLILAEEATQSPAINSRAPVKPLSQSRLAEVQASNSTSAMFLGGTRKSWERQPQGAAADQDELDKAFSAEFDRIDRQQRLEVIETGGDDESCHSDRVIAVAAAPAVAEESDESEEE